MFLSQLLYFYCSYNRLLVSISDITLTDTFFAHCLWDYLIPTHSLTQIVVIIIITNQSQKIIVFDVLMVRVSVSFLFAHSLVSSNRTKYVEWIDKFMNIEIDCPLFSCCCCFLLLYCSVLSYFSRKDELINLFYYMDFISCVANIWKEIGPRFR